MLELLVAEERQTQNLLEPVVDVSKWASSDPVLCEEMFSETVPAGQPCPKNSRFGPCLLCRGLFSNALFVRHRLLRMCGAQRAVRGSREAAAADRAA